MKHRILLLPWALVAACQIGCGGLEGGFLEPDLEMVLSPLQGNEILQFVVLSDRDRSGNAVSCEDVTSACIADQPALRIEELDTSAGKQCAFRVPLDPESARSVDGQPVSIPGIPPGTGYLLAVEVVRPLATGEERIGAGCIVIETIVKGTNPPPAGALEVRAASACLPTLDDC